MFSCHKALGKIGQTLLSRAHPSPAPQGPGLVSHLAQSKSHRGGWDSREGDRVVTVTKPAPGWCLQRLRGRSFGVLVWVQCVSAVPVGQSGAAGVVLGRDSGLGDHGGRVPRHSRSRGSCSGAVRGGDTAGNGELALPQLQWNYNSRQAPRMRGRGTEAGGARAVGPAPLAPATILSPTFTRRPTGRFFFLKGEAVAKSGPAARPRRYYGRRRSPAARSSRVGRAGEGLPLPGLARGAKGPGGRRRGAGSGGGREPCGARAWAAAARRTGGPGGGACGAAAAGAALEWAPSGAGRGGSGSASAAAVAAPAREAARFRGARGSSALIGRSAVGGRAPPQPGRPLARRRASGGERRERGGRGHSSLRGRAVPRVPPADWWTRAGGGAQGPRVKAGGGR